MNGCCFGGVCDLPWAIEFPVGSPAHIHQIEHGQAYLHGLRFGGLPPNPPEIIAVEPGEKRILICGSLYLAGAVLRDHPEITERLNRVRSPHRAAEYFESRARMGIAHARVGVPLSLYLSAFGLLQGLLLDAIVERLSDEVGRQALGGLVTRLITLDIALAAEVYHRVEVEEPDRSVRHLERQQRLLRKQLEQDALKGASSRTSLLHEMQDALKRAAKTGQPLCLIMADPDNFKVVNDSHGHLVGDKVLEEVAARIKAALREFDVVGRFGGEEFVILLENTSRHTAQQIAERIRQRIAADPIRVAGQSLQLTISQGLAVRRDGDDDHTLLQRADAAMYQAKQRGRNCVAEEPGYAARR